MPYASNQGVRIYYEVEGQGPPLVLGHGGADSLEQWRELGYVAGLRDEYWLVLADARGCGRSDKPHDPDAYRLRLRAMDVLAVLDDLDIDKAHYFGYSYGAYTGWGIAMYVPERFHSLILGGWGRPVLHDPDVHGGLIPLWEQGTKAAVAAVKPRFGEWWTPELEARLLANDAEAQIATLLVREQLDFEDVRESLTVPCLVLTSELQMRAEAPESVASLRNGTLVCLPSLDHITAHYRVDMMLPPIRKFLAEVGEG